MGDELRLFMQATEDSSAGINITQSKKAMTYPFLYIEKLTDVELSYLAENGYVTSNKRNSDDLPLYLFMNPGYKLLGYIELTFSSILHISYLMPHEVFIKPSKDIVKSITTSYFDSLLLTR